MARHIQGKDGKFAGSIGDGKSSVPTASDIPSGGVGTIAGAQALRGQYSDIYSRYSERVHEDTMTTSSPGFTRPLAADPATAPTTLTWLAESSQDNPTLVAVASNPSTPATALDGLAHRFSPETHETLVAAIAQNKSTSPQTLRRLSEYRGSQKTLAYVAGNPNTEPEIIGSLSGHRDTAVRCYAAWNPNIPSEHLDRLATDPDLNIRQGVADHPEASENALLRLGADTTEPDEWIRTAARANPRYPKKEVRTGWAATSTDRERLACLAGDTVPAVRTADPRNTATSAAILHVMRGDSNDGVRMAVASHPSTSRDTLTDMLDNEEKSGVKRAIKARLDS